MSRQYSQNRPINWGRKAQGFGAGFACGSVIGMVGSALHTRRVGGPQGIQAALFMGTMLAVGGAIRTN